MELRHLRYFVRVAEERHFGRAAQLLNIAQPPLSRQIKALEDELGVRLLDRSRAGVVLTPAGRVFFKDAKEVLARAAYAVENARHAGKGAAGELRVGHLAGPGASLIPAAMAEFRRTHPGATLTLSEMNGAELAVALRDEVIDAAFISEPDDNGPYAGKPYKPVVRYPMRVAFHSDHPLAKHERVAWHDLEREKFWMYSVKHAPTYRGWITGVCREHGFEPMIAGEVNSTTAMLTALSSGVGVALLLPSYACWAPPSIVFKPLVPEGESSEFGLVWDSSAVGALLDAWLAALAKAVASDEAPVDSTKLATSPAAKVSGKARSRTKSKL